MGIFYVGWRNVEGQFNCHFMARRYVSFEASEKEGLPNAEGSARVTQVPSEDKWRPDDARGPSRTPDLAQVSSSPSSSIRLSLL